MGNNDDTTKKSSWSIPAIIFFVVIVILIPMIRKGIDTNKIKISDSSKIIPSIEYNQEKIDSNIVAGSDSTKYIFSFNNTTTSKFEGSELVASKDSAMSGYIVIKRDKLRIGPVTSPEDYIIKGFKKTSNGGYVFETESESDEICNISILNSNAMDLVVLHFPEVQVMIYLYINRGFTLDLKLFDEMH
jgi:hypothetical protein